MIDNAQALEALQAADFSWTTHVRNIWDTPAFHIEGLHQQERKKILADVTQLAKSKDPKPPLGQVIAGPAGAGKTHFLSVLRQQLASQGLGFILVDMTDVHDFWETTVQGYISSLREESERGTPQFQLKQVIQYLLNLAGHANVSAEEMAKLTTIPLNKGIMLILNAINRRNRQAANRYQDIVRSLVLLNSDDFLFSDIGYSWLCGLEIEDTARRDFHFKTTSCQKLSDVVEGLSWILGLQSSWVLAFDQIDSIVAQHHYAKSSITSDQPSEEQLISKSIIEGVGGGLMALRDKTSRTLTVVSCLSVTWKILQQEAVKSFSDRFQDPTVLMPITQQKIAMQLVESRLRIPYQKLKRPYPTWPFQPSFFKDTSARLPREILKYCEQHRQHCLKVGKIEELGSSLKENEQAGGEKDFFSLEALFQKKKQQINLNQVFDAKKEDDVFGQWLQTVGYCLQQENSLADDIDTALDINFPGGKNYPQMHARVRLIYRAEGDREKHLCLRALQRTHHSAYKARLKAAMTTAGIDRALSFRRLVIVRTQNNDIPGGAATQQLTQKFSQAGGIFIYPTNAELQTMGALHQLKSQNLPNFDSWLQQQRPVSQLSCLQDTVAWLFGDAIPTTNSQDNSKPADSSKGAASGNAKSSSSSAKSSETSSETPTDHSSSDSPTSGSSASENDSNSLPVGKRIIGKQIGNSISIPLEALTKHTVILAGSGAGKTVLVRRLVEEAALQGIPAIVIDGANDLARMGDRWPNRPEAWSEDDQYKAEYYHHNTEVMIWTPGRESGRPLSLDPLPNFTALINDADELSQAIDMARDSLQAVVAVGKGNAAQIKRGVLRNALEHFARTGGGDLEYFAEFLKELPEEANGGISNAHKRAQEMADLLNAEIANNPLLRQRGSSLDPAILLGLENPSKTRLSIINFIGLPGLSQQQQFLNQLAMTLFTWIKKNPAPLDKPLRGLLVIDEAKDFLPSQQSTPCKSSLNRLAAQAPAL
ncbi:putative ATPase [Leptolyngbya sp. PCC 7375]|nr:putative ATPase [Leptolyngbya sp. PCC 7375]